MQSRLIAKISTIGLGLTVLAWVLSQFSFMVIGRTQLFQLAEGGVSLTRAAEIIYPDPSFAEQPHLRITYRSGRMLIFGTRRLTAEQTWGFDGFHGRVWPGGRPWIDANRMFIPLWIPGALFAVLALWFGYIPWRIRWRRRQRGLCEQCEDDVARASFPV